MKLIPVGDKLVVLRSTADDKTPGGIVLPDAAKEKPRKGKVLSVGDGVRLDNGEIVPLRVTQGQQVLFGAYAGQEVEVNGEKFLIISESDVLAIVE